MGLAPQGEGMKYWTKQFEAYIAHWPSLASQYKSLPEWSKRDCANAMKLWVDLGRVKTQPEKV